MSANTNIPQDDFATETWFVPEFIWKWLRWVLWGFSWLICILVATERGYRSWNEGNTVGKLPEEHQRADNNAGHTWIDFGGQWLHGRMVVEGHANDLYNRNRFHEIARRHYPIEDESPTSRESIVPPAMRKHGAADTNATHDATALVGWLMGTKHDHPEWRILGQGVAIPLMGGSHGNPFAQAALNVEAESRVTPEIIQKVQEPALGGPLYPPIHAFFYAPLAIFKPQNAYHILQMLCLGSTFISGLCVTMLSRGRIWCPVATAVILLLPGVKPGLDLGQNNLLTTMILLIGWTLHSRGYHIAAGLVWGLMAYKPVWAIAFILVPMLMGSWRFFFSMAGMGVALIVGTLPFTGLNAWKKWILVGREASGIYSTDQNWVRLSRDMAGVMRRLVVDTDIAPIPQSDLADLLAWVVPGLIMLITAVVYLQKAERTKVVGLAPAMVLLAAYLGCYRFMYYDVTLSFVGLAVLFASPSVILHTPRFRLVVPLDAERSTLTRRNITGYMSSFPLLILLLMFLLDFWFIPAKINFTLSADAYNRIIVNTQGSVMIHVPKVNGNSDYYYPWDTYLILALWMWCTWRVWRDGTKAA